MPVRPAALLFDLDGTLIDSYDLIASSFRHACRTVLDRDLSDGEVEARWGEPLAARFSAVDPGRVAQLVEVYTAYYDTEHSRLSRPFPGVYDMLAQLARRRFSMAVVTSKRRRSTVQALEAFRLAPFIRIAVTSEDVPAPKPAPDPIIEAARRAGARVESVWMIGDGAFDIAAAKAAGAVSIAALWGTREREALLAGGPDYVVERPEEVVALASG